jgi:hypothetical protein
MMPDDAIVTVCVGAAGLEPHGFRATTLTS